MAKRLAVAVLIVVLLPTFAAAQGGSGSDPVKPGDASKLSTTKDKTPPLPSNYDKFDGKDEGRGYNTVDALWSGIRIILALAIVSAMVWGMVWLLKRYGGRYGLLTILAGMRSSSGRGSLRMLETMAIAPGRSLHIVEVGRKILVIGTTPQSVNLVAEVTDEAEADAIRRQSFKASPFAKVLEDGEATYSEPPPVPSTGSTDTVDALRAAGDDLLAKSLSLRRRKEERLGARSSVAEEDTQA
jgi:flagellar biogenesis protein FliO